MNFFSTVYKWFGFGGRALLQQPGKQDSRPTSSLVEDTPSVGVDAALQISTVWACASLLCRTISTLPLMVYRNNNGRRELYRDSKLWGLFHESPNARMTPCEFWTAMILNFLFRGNAYARIDRSANGEAYSLWPMPADQVEMEVLEDGQAVYYYKVGNDLAVLSEDNVLHIKEIGNGVTGLSRLDYMKATTSEVKNAQTSANKLFANGGKPTGVLMVDNILSPEQRAKIRENFAEMATGSASRLYVLEADMKYQQINMSPEDLQLLETRNYGVEEICRWFGVPSVLANQNNVTSWGSGISEIVSGFYKLTIRPALVNIEQAARKRVMTSRQRVDQTVEFSFDALLRADLKDRADIYSKLVQNGIKTRNECRQLENDPPIDGGDELTAQTNLAPLNMLGKIKPGGGNATEDPIAQ